MDSTPNEHDIEALVQRFRQSNQLRQLLEIEQQPPPARFQTWWEKALPGIALAIVVETLWPAGFWWTVLWFCVMCPFLTGTIAKVLFNIYFKNELTADDARQCIDALILVSGYAITYLLHRIIYVVSIFIRYLLRFVWRYPLWTCTVCGLFLGLKLFIPRQRIIITNICSKLVYLVLSLMEWMVILHFRGSVLCRKIWASIKESNTVRTCKLYLKNGILRVLGRPRFEELDQFAYSPLPSEQRQIRLLRLTRQNPIFDLQAELRCYSLDDALPYEAISYVWGKDTEKKHPVILNDRRYYVSTNVYQILLRRGSLFGSRLIWIDSICIDQSDNVEKSEQVKMMRDIYHRASHVSVCLGENPDAWLAWGLLTQLVFYNSFMTAEGLTAQILNIVNTKDSNEWLSAQLTAFLDLLDHSWFSRVWVVQEVVVARSVTIWYGNKWLPWDQFIQIMDILFSPGVDGLALLLQHTGKGTITRPVPFGAVEAAFMNGFREKFRNGQAYQLYYTLRMFLAFKSTSPRDKIFALIGLTKSASELSHIIDYEKPLSRILVQVADCILEEGHLFEVLHLAGIGWDKARTDTPSWVVDWSISREPVTLAHSFVDDHLQYRAAVQRASEISRGSDRGHIRVRGQFIDRISEIGLKIMEGPDLNERNNPLESLDDMISWLQEAEDLVYKYAAAPYHNKQDLPQALWRALIGDRTETTRPAPVAYETNFLKQRQFMLAAKDAVARYGSSLDGIQQCPPDANPFLGPFPSPGSGRDWIEDMSKFTWLCGVPAFPRKLAITSKGYIAMVPKGSKSSDIICAFWGAQVPFILRSLASPTNEETGMYHLVGECYVHGMMDGECFKLPFEDEVFEIV